MSHDDTHTRIDDRLDRAATEARRRVETMELRSITTQQGRDRSKRLVAAGGAFALMMGAAGLAAILVTQEPARQPLEFGSDATPTAPAESGTTPALDPTPDSATSLEAIPQLGLVLDGWGTVTAGDRGHIRGVYYSHEDDGGTEDERTTVGIETAIFATPEELGDALAEKDGHWTQVVENGDATRLNDVIVGTGDTARAYLLKESTATESSTVWFTWESSSRSLTNLIVSYGSIDDARTIARSVVELSDEDWNAILTEAAALSAGDGSGDE